MEIVYQILVGSSLAILVVLACESLASSYWRKVLLPIFRRFRGSELVVMGLCFVCATMHAQKVTTVYVDQAAIDEGDGTQERPYRDIQTAIDANASGTNRLEIHVAPGTYGPVDVDGQTVDIIASTNQGSYVIDGNGADWAVAARNQTNESWSEIVDFEIRNSTNGVAGFWVANCDVGGYQSVGVSNCMVSSSLIGGGMTGAILSSLSTSQIKDGKGIGALSSKMKNVEIADCRIGAVQSALTNCILHGSTQLGAADSVVASSFVTNNFCCALSNCTVDTCLIAENDQGVIDGLITCSTVAANRFSGISGNVVAYNTVLAYNKDGNGHYLNCSGDRICMTNCCSSPIPSDGTNNVLCGLPINPRTYKPRLYSPVIGAGCTNFVFTPRDLSGRYRNYTGVTDIGAFIFATTSISNCTKKTLIPVPYEWLKEKLRASYNDKKGKGLITAWEDNGSYVRFNYDRYYDGILHVGLYANIKCETMANYESGKKLPDGSPMTWWMEYLCGTDPNNTNEYFTANIAVTNGVPSISWRPDLGDDRLYLIMGTRDLNEEWELVDDPATTDCNLFKVAVELN